MTNLRLAEGMMKEAMEDLRSAKGLFSMKSFARCLFFCEQALEKSMKACLLLKGHGTLVEHDVSTLFAIETREFDSAEIKEAITIAYDLESIFGKTRYPREYRGKIILPSESFDKKLTDKRLRNAEKAFKIFSKVFNNIKTKIS